MTFDEFRKKYEGKGIDYDGSFGNQCVDLYRQYVKEVLGYPQSPPVVGAKDIWDTYLPEYYTRIENTPHGVPDKGDIVIFSMGRFGHVSIFIEGNTSRFTSFDQNYPSGTLCHIQGHTYSAVIGWLRPLNKEEEIPMWLKQFLQEKGLTTNDEGKIREIFGKAQDYDSKVKELTEQIKSANEMLSSKSLEVASLADKVEKLESKVFELEEQYNQTRKDCADATWRAERLGIENERLQDEIEGFKEKNNLYAYTWWKRLGSLFRRG